VDKIKDKKTRKILAIVIKVGELKVLQQATKFATMRHEKDMENFGYRDKSW